MAILNLYKKLLTLTHLSSQTLTAINYKNK